MRTRLCQISEKTIGQHVICNGWITKCHSLKKVGFIWLSDDVASRLVPLQCVFNFGKHPDHITMNKLTRGCSVSVTGEIVSSKGNQQAFEMLIDTYELIGAVKDPATYVMAKDDYQLEYLRGIPEMECHSTIKSLIYVIRSKLMEATELYFKQAGMLKVDMPLITMSQCEGGANPAQVTDFLKTHQRSAIPVIEGIDKIDYSIDFAKCATYLTESAQLQLETQLPLCSAGVWTETRATRFEPSVSTKHLACFTMIEVEIPFIKNALDLMAVTEDSIRFCSQYVLDHCSAELDQLDKFWGASHKIKLIDWVTKPFAQITHSEAVTMMQAQKDGTFLHVPDYNEDLSTEHELWLVDEVFKRPTFVMKYPKAVKSFYMPIVQETYEESHGVQHVDSYDLLVPETGELVGGSARIFQLKELEDRIAELGLDRKPLEFYIKLREDGTIPHGGWGWGHERFVKMITGAPSVKDCVQFPFYIGCGITI